MQKLHAMMLAGTGSNVGKSILATAFCRIFLQDGYNPAPFKAQNMALNSYATPEGLEIGRAQAVQAEAAGIPCHTDMNPLLLKPQSDHTSQVVLNGHPAGIREACDYFRREAREEFRQEIRAAYDRLETRYNPIVLEGAGSIAEINLRDTDLANMSMAAHAKADVFLVGDIDRGGVFASIYGSLALLRPEERKLVKGILVNKFRGDIRLFQPGVKMLEELCGIPVVGVIPYYHDIYIDEEDSVALAAKPKKAERDKVNVGVVRVQHLSNFTDFNALERDPRVHLFYSDNAHELEKADILILPGSKSVTDDLEDLKQNGAADAVLRARQNGATILGICGGYQMMGREISDPEEVESSARQCCGLGLLPVCTRMNRKKITRQTRFRLYEEEDGETWMEGYEIHMGTTHPDAGEASHPLTLLEDGSTDGYKADHCMGTYLHGILDNRRFIDFLLAPHTEQQPVSSRHHDYHAFKEEQYDKLAAHVRSNADLPLIYKILTTSNTDRP